MLRATLLTLVVASPLADVPVNRSPPTVTWLGTHLTGTSSALLTSEQLTTAAAAAAVAVALVTKERAGGAGQQAVV